MKPRTATLCLFSVVALAGTLGVFIFNQASGGKSSDTAVKVAGHTQNLTVATPAQINALHHEQEARVLREQTSKDLAQEAGRPMDIFTGKIGGGTYRERLAALREMLVRGNEKDIAKLYQLAGQPTQGTAFKGLKHLEWAGLVNEIMDYAVTNDPDMARALDYLYTVASNKAQNPTIRDYACQHLDRMFARLGQPETPDPEGREKIQKVLWKLAQDPRSALAGTSILSLDRMMAGDMSEADRDRLKSAAGAVLKDASAHPASQITCLALSARLGNPEALGVARNMLKEEQNNVTRAVACIGVVAQMGEVADLPLLDQLIQKGEPTVKRAAYAALSKLKNRLGAS